MTHAGLFSGIGGFSLAARWMGWENVFDVELDEWCRKVLHKNFPTTQLFTDVCTFDGLPFRGRIDVLSGGFPCQPFSTAGLGLGTADPRHLWPEYLRIIREIRPAFVVGENVRGLLSWGGGLQFEAVCADLEAAGYEVQPLVLPAAGVGAIHRRDRIWFVAHASGGGRIANEPAIRSQSARQGVAADAWHVRAASHPSSLGRRPSSPFARRVEADGNTGLPDAAPGAWRFSEPAVCAGNDGLPGGLVRPDRARILKAAGNAIVPQVALQLFQAIQATAA